MPKSATGTLSNLPDSRGFTLIELIVVLLIIGVMLGAIGFSLGGTRERQLELEGERLAALLRLAREETLLTAGEIAAVFHAEGYFFLTRGEDDWQLLSGGVFRPRLLDPDQQLTLYFPEEGHGAVPLPYLQRDPGLLLDSPSGAPGPDYRAAHQAATAGDLPRIYFYAGGEINPPFELALSLSGNPHPMVISGEITGRIGIVDGQDNLFR